MRLLVGTSIGALVVSCPGTAGGGAVFGVVVKVTIDMFSVFWFDDLYCFPAYSNAGGDLRV